MSTMKPNMTSATSRTLLLIFGGAIVALLTGLVSNTPPMLVGAIHYGYPFPWLTRLVIAPQYYPWRVNLPNLFADIIVWFVTLGIVFVALERLRKTASR